jgi:hypothetical protein
MLLSHNIERGGALHRSAIVALSLIGILSVDGAADAQTQKHIYTAGEHGAYHSSFCPPIVAALDKSGFHGYACTTSGGTPDNIAKVLTNPRSLGFAQLDVLARWTLDNLEAAKRIVVIRTLACEGLWMVSSNKDMSTVTFGQIAGHARHLKFAVADGGSRASFEFLTKIDAEGIGRVRDIRVVENATAVIEQVASHAADVGFFVQFAESTNPNFRLLEERKLHTVPVINHEMAKAKVSDTPVYQVQSFNLSNHPTTACTPTVIVTGTPEVIVDTNDALDQRALLQRVKTAPENSFLPNEGRLARLMSGSRSIPGAQIKDMLSAYDVAKRVAEASAP